LQPATVPGIFGAGRFLFRFQSFHPKQIHSSETTRNCWDNAPTESFFDSLKNERVHGTRYSTRAEAEADLFDYIELFYNHRRRHSTLGYASPTKFMEDWINAQHKQKFAA
jgi:hypothetical protein